MIDNRAGCIAVRGVPSDHSSNSLNSSRYPHTGKVGATGVQWEPTTDQVRWFPLTSCNCRGVGVDGVIEHHFKLVGAMSKA